MRGRVIIKFNGPELRLAQAFAAQGNLSLATAVKRVFMHVLLQEVEKSRPGGEPEVTKSAAASEASK